MQFCNYVIEHDTQDMLFHMLMQKSYLAIEPLSPGLDESAAIIPRAQWVCSVQETCDYMLTIKAGDKTRFIICFSLADQHRTHGKI